MTRALQDERWSEDAGKQALDTIGVHEHQPKTREARARKRRLYDERRQAALAYAATPTNEGATLLCPAMDAPVGRRKALDKATRWLVAPSLCAVAASYATGVPAWQTILLAVVGTTACFLEYADIVRRRRLGTAWAISRDRVTSHRVDGAEATTRTLMAVAGGAITATAYCEGHYADVWFHSSRDGADATDVGDWLIMEGMTLDDSLERALTPFRTRYEVRGEPKHFLPAGRPEPRVGRE